MTAPLSFFPLAVLITRAQAAPILAKIAKPEPKEIDYEGRQLNYEAYIDGKRESEAMNRDREP